MDPHAVLGSLKQSNGHQFLHALPRLFLGAVEYLTDQRSFSDQAIGSIQLAPREDGAEEAVGGEPTIIRQGDHLAMPCE